MKKVSPYEYLASRMRQAEIPEEQIEKIMKSIEPCLETWEQEQSALNRKNFSKHLRKSGTRHMR